MVIVNSFQRNYFLKINTLTSKCMHLYIHRRMDTNSYFWKRKLGHKKYYTIPAEYQMLYVHTITVFNSLYVILLRWSWAND